VDNLSDIPTLVQMHLEEAGRKGLLPTWQSWRFRWGKGTRTFGLCQYRSRTISISKHLAAVNTEERVERTVIHEVAHAVAGHAAGHGPAWKDACKALGYANPERCWSTQDTNPVELTTGWTLECPSCGSTHRQSRLSRQFQEGIRHYLCRKCRVQLVAYRTEHGRPANMDEVKPVPAARRPRVRRPRRHTGTDYLAGLFDF
jgi:predicted SprT family Zn-dependent metalloprotease